MEMCVDNPRQGFGELFDTHPTVESRVAALVKFAGGHDPGPLALPPAGDERRRGPIRTARARRPVGITARARTLGCGSRELAPKTGPAARRRRRTSTLPRHRDRGGRTATASAPSAKPALGDTFGRSGTSLRGQPRLGKSPARVRSAFRLTSQWRHNAPRTLINSACYVGLPNSTQDVQNRIRGKRARRPRFCRCFLPDCGARRVEYGTARRQRGVDHGEANSDRGGCGQGRRRQDDGRPHVARLFHGASRADARLRY